MTRLLANRASVLVAAAFFMAATWLNLSLEHPTAPTTLVLAQPEPMSNALASLEKGPRL